LSLAICVKELMCWSVNIDSAQAKFFDDLSILQTF